jgi:hypothetical protein
MSGSANPKLSPYEEQILANVREHGCHITCVLDPDELDPPFAYSTGFVESVGQPEVILFGLPKDVMHYAINATLDQCRAGLKLEEGTRVENVLEGYALVVRKVRPENIVIDYLNSAMWHHRLRSGAPLEEVVQLVWPGVTTNLYPWDRDCPPEVRDAQPALYETRLH